MTLDAVRTTIRTAPWMASAFGVCHVADKPMHSQPQVKAPAQGSALSPTKPQAQGDEPCAATEIDNVLAEMVDPFNRFYRYPAARLLLPLALKTPLKPNHVTAIHACIGIIAGLLIARGRTTDFVIAFVLAEVRMILDCFDGELARAKKLFSPNGRTIDEIGDMVGYVSMQLGALFFIRARWPSEHAIAFFFGCLIVPGWMAMTYDYYKRTFVSAMRGTDDDPASVLVARVINKRREGASAVARFAIIFEWIQTFVITPFEIPSLIARIREGLAGDASDVRKKLDDRRAPVQRGLRRRIYTPRFRRVLRMLSAVTGDNAVTFFNLGLLTGALALVEKLVIGVGMFTFVLTAAVCSRYVRDASNQETA